MEDYPNKMSLPSLATWQSDDVWIPNDHGTDWNRAYF